MIETEYGEKPQIHYWAAGVTGALEEFKTYGGSLVENITQAVARDLMAHGMLNCEESGTPIVLTVHDEVVGEADELTESEEASIGYKQVLDEFMERMCAVPGWAAGCPVKAEGFVSRRYRK